MSRAAAARYARGRTVWPLLNLLLLAPEIIAAPDAPKERAPRLAERDARRPARVVDHEEPRAMLGRMVAALSA